MPALFTRASLSRGPGYVTIGGATLFPISDMDPRHSPEFNPVKLSLHGQIDKYKTDFVIKHRISVFGLFSSLPGIVVIHIIFSMPVMTLLFRNYYQSIPQELFKAARIDGGGFIRIFLQLMLPMSTPIIIVAAIMQVTGVWNDYILGLVFAGRDNLPMTVQLNNVINTTTGTRLYNVNMAATILTSLVPLTIYFVSGRWFVRGIAAGAVKG